MREVYLKIEGRVQGVGFRRWVVSKAESLGVSGWVRNESDGSVEVLMRGEDEAVNEMVQFCYKGPLFARVDNISFEKGVEYAFPPIKEGRFIRI